MRIVVCVKYVPVLSALRFDPGTRRLVREGVPGEASSFDVRALGAALALRRTHGGEVVALTMGPPAARDGLVHCLALGADRAIHLLDPLLAGSDTLATARALSAALRREAPDVVLLGRASVDAETGQVGPEVAELLGWPQVTAARRLSVDPATRRFTAEREADDGFETLAGQLPAVVTAAVLAVDLGGPVEALVIGRGAAEAPALAAAGADRVLVAEGPGLDPYTTDAHAAVLAEAIRARAPRLVLLGSTALGRDLAPRVAARLGLGLTGDAIDLDLDAEGRVRQHKPAFGGTIVAPILSRTRPEMATVRPGMLRSAEPDAARRAVVEKILVPTAAPRVEVVRRELLPDTAAALDSAAVVLGVGKGIGGPAALPAIGQVAERLGAAIGATREVTDAGWLPKQYQVGLTGRAISPRLYVALGVSGAMEHLVGLRRAATIVAVNKNPKAPIFKAADLGVVADWAAVLPHLEAALRA